MGETWKVFQLCTTHNATGASDKILNGQFDVFTFCHRVQVWTHIRQLLTRAPKSADKTQYFMATLAALLTCPASAQCAVLVFTQRERDNCPALKYTHHKTHTLTQLK